MYSRSATLTLINSTVSGNTAGGDGGGVYNQYSLTLINSTISGNLAGSDGGGVYNISSMRLTNSTVTGNSAKFGGGLFNVGVLSLNDTLISGNTASSQGPEVVQQLPNAYANSSNLFGHDGDAGVYSFSFTPGANDIVPSEPLSVILGPLADNGGPTKTHALPPSSPAIDLVPAAACATSTDQRGAPRPQDGDGNTVANCDTGAFEVGSTPVEARPAEPNPQLRCTGSACRVRIECTLTSNSAIGCTNQVNIFVRRSAVKLGDDTAAKGPSKLRFAFGVANIPPDQTANVRLKLTKKGKKIVRTSKQKRLRGVMEIRNSAGTAVSSTPIRIRFR